MSTAGIPYPARGPFSPRFILPNELTLYGLPDANRQPNILSMVDAASVSIDTHCGRLDSEGNGSLVYSTYMERLLMQSRNNIVRCNFKPLVSLPASVISNLSASANYIPTNPATNQPIKAVTANTGMFTNYFWTGCQANTIPVTNVPGSTLSPFIGASGRYGGTVRPSGIRVWPDANYGVNPLMIAAFFGGPPNWTTIDAGMIDFDTKTGEIWVPAGLWAAQYTEIVVVYNSGFDPLNMPRAIKQATAMLIRNFLSRGGGTTGLRSINTAGTANISFSPELIDEHIDSILQPFKNIIAY
jgi:hypothetical protein